MAASYERGRVEPFDDLRALSLERDVETLRGWSIVGEEELVRGEPTVSLTDTKAERGKCARVEALACLEVAHTEVDMVEKATGMRLRHRYFVRSFDGAGLTVPPTAG